MYEMIGKNVEVQANGITYKGKLVEIGEREVHLESQTGWLVIRNDQITSIQKVDESH